MTKTILSQKTIQKEVDNRIFVYRVQQFNLQCIASYQK